MKAQESRQQSFLGHQQNVSRHVPRSTTTTTQEVQEIASSFEHDRESMW
jgi:hypothetical protein